MGILIDGKWVDDEKDLYHDKKGKFNRPDSPVRHWVTADGSPGPTGEGGFAAEPGRYHLYVAINCPWAHRTIIFRLLLTVYMIFSVDPVMLLSGFATYMAATISIFSLTLAFLLSFALAFLSVTLIALATTAFTFALAASLAFSGAGSPSIFGCLRGGLPVVARRVK